MHLRVSRVRRNGKSYEYTQLVESFRRPSDGMPATRVIASLGQLSSAERENIKAALAASRIGKKVVLPSTPSPRRTQPAVLKPSANLRYLDAAVLLELWRDLGLSTLFDELIPQNDSDVSAGDVLASLAIQRCVAPRSKLFAQRWFPKSALPELTGVSPEQFNNTRLHRVLAQLHDVSDALMRRLPRHYQQRDGRFASLFMDLTDTWFTGGGCEMAQRGKNKEGFVAFKIGIVLLCNEHGYPLRWQVIEGNQSDGVAMTQMLRDVDGMGWLSDAPLVMDRAMGHTAHLQAMLSTSIRFITALTVSEFGSYTDGIPYRSMSDIEVPDSRDNDKELLEQLRTRAKQADMQRVSDDLYVLDLGICELGTQPPANASANSDKTTVAMQQGIEIERLLRGGEASYQSVSRLLGISNKATARRSHQLTKLDHDLQQEILNGQATGLSLAHLIRLTELEPEQQRASFNKAIEAARSKPDGRAKRVPARQRVSPPANAKTLKVRLVTYFNPGLFLQKRRTTNNTRRQIEVAVNKLNAGYRTGKSRRTESELRAVVSNLLKKHNMSDVFDVSVGSSKLNGRRCPQAKVTIKPEVWRKRLRYHGFSLIVAHSELKQSAETLCKLYRGKDVVEKDFQNIKSLIKVRPIWHRTDPKVSAHVTLCMLSLLLERVLRKRLRSTKSHDISSQRALELLSECRLNRYISSNSPALYATTQDEDAHALLRDLKMSHLADDDEIGDRITPR
jgi:transposase